MGVIEGVEKLGPELKLLLLVNPENLEQRNIPIVDAGPDDHVTAFVPESKWGRGREGRANSTFTFLHQFFGWCADEEGGDLLDTDPCSGVHTPYRYRERERVLSADEIKYFWIAAGEMGQIGTIARLLLLTAQRRGEIAGAVGCDVTPVFHPVGTRVRG